MDVFLLLRWHWRLTPIALASILLGLTFDPSCAGIDVLLFYFIVIVLLTVYSYFARINVYIDCAGINCFSCAGIYV